MSVQRILLATAAAVLLVSSPSPLFACPDCDTALATRRRVADEDFAWRLSIAVLPFAISVAGAVAAGRTIDRRKA